MISLPQQMKKWKNVSMLSWTYSKVKPTYKTDEDWPQIVGKGFIPPNSKIPPFLKIQDVPTFYRPLGKTEVVNESFNQFVYILPTKYLNFGRTFIKVVKCKFDIMPLNVFSSILWKMDVS